MDVASGIDIPDLAPIIGAEKTSAGWEEPDRTDLPKPGLRRQITFSAAAGGLISGEDGFVAGRIEAVGQAAGSVSDVKAARWIDGQIAQLKIADREDRQPVRPVPAHDLRAVAIIQDRFIGADPKAAAF